MKFTDWIKDRLSIKDTFIEKVTHTVGSVSTTTETKIKVPRRAGMDEIDRLLAAAKGVKLDTEIVVPARAVNAEGATTTLKMNCADCGVECMSSVSTKWLTSVRSGERIVWSCASCGLEQYCSITPQ